MSTNVLYKFKEDDSQLKWNEIDSAPKRKISQIQQNLEKILQPKQDDYFHLRLNAKTE